MMIAPAATTSAETPAKDLVKNEEEADAGVIGKEADDAKEAAAAGWEEAVEENAQCGAWWQRGEHRWVAGGA